MLWRWVSLLVAPLLVWELPPRGFSNTELFYFYEELHHATKGLLTKRNAPCGDFLGRVGLFSVNTK